MSNLHSVYRGSVESRLDIGLVAMNPVGTFELFKIGIGPSSSHTVGPMVAARRFALQLEERGVVPARLKVELYGSLGATGRGHGSDRAVLLGLEGDLPATVDVDGIEARMAAFGNRGGVRLPGGARVRFDPSADIILHRRRSLPAHPNAMRFAAFDAAGGTVLERRYYSIGGGFVVDEDRVVDGRIVADASDLAAAPDRAVPVHQRRRPAGDVRRRLRRHSRDHARQRARHARRGRTARGLAGAA